ncbi:MAG: Arc family DNA-binding protein [Candidatus Aminicenantes bacterium]|nr:MAG: Arc family DNA-binding protein [Candidatus Aminicenantes bacterium]
MMTTLTIKNIPMEVYERLKRRAKANRRSINQEVIAVIEHALDAPPIDVNSTLERTRKIRELTAQYRLQDKELEEWKNEGRK